MPRIRLRTFFLIFFCAAVGLTIGTRPDANANHWAASLGVYQPKLDWHHASLAAASVAIVIGLVQRAAQLRKLDLRDGPQSEAIALSMSYSAGWRYLCAGMLILCLLTTLLLSRRIITLPETETFFPFKLFPYVVWIGCILLTVFAGLSRWRQSSKQGTSSWLRYVIFWLGGRY